MTSDLSTQERRLLAGRQVTAKVLADEVRALTGETREQLEPALGTEEAVAAELPDGTRLGKVSLSKPSETAKVTDEAALLAWVRQHRPTELIESVNPAYVEALRQQAKTYGHAFDAATGEVIPGVEAVTGSASYRVTPSKEARELVLARLAELVRGGLLALPPGQDNAA